MRRRILVLLLAAFGFSGGAAIWALVGSAQTIDTTACQQACVDQQSACLSACGSESNPADCDDHCQDQYEDCMDQCGG